MGLRIEVGTRLGQTDVAHVAACAIFPIAPTASSIGMAGSTWPSR
jgi:hypothetical protein